MSSVSTNGKIWRFGAFEVDFHAALVRKHGVRIRVQQQPLKILGALLERPGELVTREELRQQLWPSDTFVDFEQGLNAAVTRLRQALGDSAATPRFIETHARLGYRFIAPVEAVNGAHSSVEAPARRSILSRTGRRNQLLAVIAGVAIVFVLAYVVRRQRVVTGHESAWASPIRLTSYPGSEVAPTFSPDGSQVAFAWHGGSLSNFDIYVKVAADGDPFRLTSDPADEFSPAWSPDGRSIAFLRASSPESASVYIKPALGGAERKLLDLSDARSVMRLLRRIAWTPDGNSLVIGGSFRPPVAAGLRVVSVSGGSTRILTPTAPGAIDFAPSFDPAGRRLAFIRHHEVRQGDVYVVDIKEDYTTAGDPVQVTAEKRAVSSVAWMPDGKTLIYSIGTAVGLRSLRQVSLPQGRGVNPPVSLPFGEGARALSASGRGSVVYSRENISTNIWYTGLDAAGAPAGPASSLIASTLYNHFPDYSPDGTRVAFTSTRSGTEEIWVSASDGANPLRLTRMGGPTAAMPRWSPDGRTILFHSNESGMMSLYLIDPATANIRRLTSDTADARDASWSRDGKFIYFTSLRSGRRAIWRMPAGGGSALKLTDGIFAKESSDGRVLYVASETTIRSMPLGGGDSKELVNDLSSPLNFAVAENGIYYTAEVPGSPSAIIRFYNLKSHSSSTILNTGKRSWFGMALSPDRRRLLYSLFDYDDSDLVFVEKSR